MATLESGNIPDIATWGFGNIPHMSTMSWEMDLVKLGETGQDSTGRGLTGGDGSGLTGGDGSAQEMDFF